MDWRLSVCLSVCLFLLCAHDSPKTVQTIFTTLDIITYCCSGKNRLNSRIDSTQKAEWQSCVISVTCIGTIGTIRCVSSIRWRHLPNVAKNKVFSLVFARRRPRIHNMTMTSFICYTLYGQCCRRHVVGQQVISDISVVRNC